MEEIRWNFPDVNRLEVKLMKSDRILNITGEISSDSRLFVASTQSVRRSSLSGSEQNELMERLSYLTRNDRVQIVWE